jgi:hypothetical protein
MGECRKLHNEELHKLYTSTNKIKIIKSKRMSWSGHVVPTGIRGMHIEYWWESHKEIDH